MSAYRVELTQPFQDYYTYINVNYVTAAKDYPQEGIKKGEPYYWWKYPFNEKKRMKERPTRWNLESNLSVPSPIKQILIKKRAAIKKADERGKRAIIKKMLTDNPEQFLELLEL